MIDFSPTAEPRCSLSQLEDNLSEANVQLAEVEKSQAEINAIRLQGKFFDSFVQCYLPLILLFPYISVSSGSPALTLPANLPNLSSFHFSFSPVRLNQFLSCFFMQFSYS